MLCHENNMDKFIDESKKYINKWFKMDGNEYLNDEHQGIIVNDKQFKRVTDMIKNTNGEVICGGNFDSKTRKVQPTLVKLNDYNDSSMEQETFGPVLWVLPIKNIEEAVNYINTRDKSLSLYMFSKNNKNIDYVVNNTSSGGTEINGVASYLGNHNLGFGGVGRSGMGSYHGDYTFFAFSHVKPVVKKLAEGSLFYPPRNTKFKMNLLKRL